MIEMSHYKFGVLFLLTAFSCALTAAATSDPDRWQQRVKYKMEIDFDVSTHQFTGKQWLQYTNNSPDNVDYIEIDVEKSAYKNRIIKTMEIGGYPATWVGYTRVNGTDLRAVNKVRNAY